MRDVDVTLSDFVVAPSLPQQRVSPSVSRLLACVCAAGEEAAAVTPTATRTTAAVRRRRREGERGAGERNQFKEGKRERE